MRQAARAFGFDHALAVRAGHRVDTPAGRFTATALAARVPARNRMRIRTGHGLRGDRHHDWATPDIRPDDTPEGQVPGHAYLLARRHRYTRELSLHHCHSTTPVALVHTVCTRWKAEEDF